MKWFRLWVDIVNDIKMLQLTDYEYRMFTYLMAYAASIDSLSGELHQTFKSLSLHFHQRFNLFSRANETFQKLGLIAVDEFGFITITNWNKRQYISDNAYARVKKFREVTQKRNVSKALHETAPETETETDNIYSRKSGEVLAYLNGKTGKKYRDDSLIKARIKDGGSVDDCKKIIDTKLKDKYFIENPKYLCPATLFRKSHWDTYLNECEEVKKSASW